MTGPGGKAWRAKEARQPLTGTGDKGRWVGEVAALVGAGRKAH
jgi:hypothetical protein